MFLSCKAQFYQIFHIYAKLPVESWKTLFIEPKGFARAFHKMKFQKRYNSTISNNHWSDVDVRITYV